MTVNMTNILGTKSDKLIITFNSGLTLTAVLTGHTKPEVKEEYKQIWENYLSKYEDKIQFLKRASGSTLIYLPPAIYWEIYKKMKYGKNLITNYAYTDENNNPYTFPQPNDYFSNTLAPIQGGNGIYGIYVNDKLIYIGYTVNGFLNRYDQHKYCFVRGYGKNDMYLQGFNINQIEFRELITEEEIQKLFHTTAPIDKEILQLIEYSLIKVLQPPFNKDGITSPYEIDSNSPCFRLGEEVSTTSIIRHWLLDEYNSIKGQTIRPEEVWTEEFEERIK